MIFILSTFTHLGLQVIVMGYKNTPVDIAKKGSEG